MWKAKMAAMVRGSVRSGGAWMAAMAWKIARKADPWLSKPRSSHARYFHAFLIFVVALGLSIFFIPIGGGEANASVDGKETADAAIVAEAADTATPDVPPRDVVMVPVPIFVPRPPERDAGADTPEDADATAIPLPDTLTPAETLPDVTAIETADDYLDRIAEARRIANWRRATARLEELIRKWPERPEAWEALGDTLVTAPGQTERARAAYARCLELLPRGALTKRALVEGKLRGLK
jgi:tetratricopeptide (TPR) repeat protein